MTPVPVFAIARRVLGFCAFIATAILLYSAFQLITAQYEVRMLHAEQRRAEVDQQNLRDESSRLLALLAQSGQTAEVARKARAVGFAEPGLKQVVFLKGHDIKGEAR